jgi:hypothetical protein
MRTFFIHPVTRILWLVPALLLVGTAPRGGAPAAASAGGAACGDGLFSVGETCDTCPADCQPKACKTDAKAHRRYALAITAPEGHTPTGVTALVSYRSGTLSVPGTASEPSVEQRIQRHVNPDLLVVRDADYAMSITLSMAKGLPTGPLLEIDFDTCAGAPTASAADVTCELVGCAGGGEPLTGCSCQITAL